MENKNKICLVIPSLQAGGMERVMAELATYFSAKEEAEVHLVLYGISREVFYDIPQNIIIHKPSYSFKNSFRFYFTIRTLLYVRETIKRIGPLTILSFGELWNSFILLSLLGLKYPVYISDRCRPDKKFGWFQEILRKFLYPRADGIIAQTHKAKEIYMKRFNHRNIKVIGNPIRLIDSNNTFVLKENIVLSIGRLITTKHYDRLINIFYKLKAPDWKLVIVGGNALGQNNWEKLQKQIKELNLNNRVILAGKQKNVAQYFIKSKIFVFTSSSEGFPNVIGEALSSGLPVISYDCIAGPSEMIRDGYNGFLVPVFEDQLFQKKLQSLVDKEESRNEMSVNAKSILGEFSIEKIGFEYYSFITSGN